MTMNIPFDIETIPSQDQNVIDGFIKDSKENFKAPSDMSKKRALLEMGLDASVEPQKYWTKDDAIKMWENRFKEEKYMEVADEKYRKTSFDGALGEVISISYSNGIDIFNVHRELGSNYTEYHLLEEFFTGVHELCNRKQHKTKPLFIGHNIGAFDLKFLYQRSVILGIDPGFDLPFRGRHGKDYYDTMVAWAGHGNRISQNNLARAMGIAEKPDDIDGSQVWDFIKRGDAKRVAEYNDYDVETVIKIYNKLNFKDMPVEDFDNEMPF